MNNFFSEKNYRKFFNNAHDAIIILDAVTKKILDINSAASDMYGYTVEEILKLKVTDLSAEPEKTIEAINKGVNHIPVRYHRKKDGIIFPVEITISFIDEDDRQLHMSFVRDITERKKNEEKLADLLELNQKLIDSSSVGIIAYNATSGRCILANRAAAEIVNCTVEDLLDQNFLHIESWKKYNILELAEDTISEQKEHHTEIYMITDFGRGLYLEIRFTPFISRGEPHLLIVFSDITEKKHIEEKVKESERNLRKMIEVSPVAMAIADLNGDNPVRNKKFIETFGYTAEDCRTIEEWFIKAYPDTGYREKVKRTWNQALEKVYETGKEMEPQIWKVTCKDGTVKDIEFSCMIAGNKNIIILHDITEYKRIEKILKKARDDAEAASRAKSEFLSGMSHELRTPLNAILGYTDIFINDENLREKQKRGMEIIKKSGRHLLNLINDILNVAKMEEKKEEIERTSFNLQNLLNSMKDMAEIKGKEKNLTFFFECDRDIPLFVLGDEKKLWQILTNLLDNAIKFTKKGTVRLKVKKYDKKILFLVEDTGSGIPHNRLEDIFSPFKQLSDELHKSDGTGLGLTISRNLVRLMGGELYADSIYGKGSRFWFEIELPELLTDERCCCMKDINNAKSKSLEEKEFIPPLKILETLYAYADEGDIKSLQIELDNIRNSDEKYENFCRKFKKLLNNFEIDKLIELLKYYRVTL
ncbi:MAG: PAS domain S-box protein [Candidatus Eremiobacterota bacterium]